MKQVRDVLRLHSVMNLSLRRIEGATGVAKSTISDYIKRFMASGLHIEQINVIDDDALRLKLFGEQIKDVGSNRAVPDMSLIHKEMKLRKKTKVTLRLLWEEYKESNPNGYSYTQFRFYYRKYKQILNPSMRQTHLAGEKLFVDYSGLTMPIYDQRTGEVHYAQIFVAVLGASGYTETYHYHLDMLMDEDDHIAYKEPFSIAILRSFALNLYQLFLNANRNKKVLPTGKTTMAEIKRNCLYRDDFTAELFEQNPQI